MVALGEIEGTPVEHRPGQGRGLGLEDLQRALPFLAAIGPHEVEVMPVGGHLAPEVRRAGEGFTVEELVFDQAVHRLHVTLPGVTLGRDGAMVCTQGADGGGQALLVLVFEELTTVVGLPGQTGQIDAVPGQMDGELFGQEGGVGLGQFVGVAGEAGAGDRLAGGVLEAGQLEVGHLWPVMGNVLQILGVGGELAEERPAAFDVAELLLGGGLLFARTGQVVLAEDAGDGVVADGECKLVLEALGTEAGLFAESDDEAFQRGGGLMRAVLGAAGEFAQGGRFTGDVAAEPLAGGVAGATELAGGGLEAVGAGEGDEFLMQPMAIGAHTVKFKVGAMHAGRMANSARRCCASSGGGAAAPPCGGNSTP